MTRIYLAKSNGKDLNLVNGYREMWGMSMWCVFSVALPNISYRWKLAWQASNLRIHESKSCALPLGDTPLYYRVINSLCGNVNIQSQNSLHSGNRWNLRCE